MKQPFIDPNGRTWLSEKSGAPEARINSANTLITTSEQLDAFTEIIGTQNVEAGRKALEDGAQIWIFQTVEEVEACQELSSSEKITCVRCFEEGLGYAGFVRVGQGEQGKIIRRLRSDVGAKLFTGLEYAGNRSSNNGLNYKPSH